MVRKRRKRKQRTHIRIVKTKRGYRKVIVNPGTHMTGRKHLVGEMKDKDRDEDLKALPPGRRVSESGKVYYEYRSNRADLDRKKRL